MTYAIVLAALLIGFLASEAKAIFDEGAVVLVPFICRTEQAAFDLSEQDAISLGRARAYLKNLIDEGVCGILFPPAHIPLGRLLHVYTDSNGVISEIRAVLNPRTGQEWFTLTADPKQPSPIKEMLK